MPATFGTCTTCWQQRWCDAGTCRTCKRRAQATTPAPVLDLSWRQGAPCTRRDWNGSRKQGTWPGLPILDKLTICRTQCPVRERCLAYARTQDAEGVWGGECWHDGKITSGRQARALENVA